MSQSGVQRQFDSVKKSRDQRDAARSAAPANFWSRQTVRDRIAIATISAQVVVTGVLLVIGVVVPDTALGVGGRIALLSGNIVLLFLLLQFSLTRFFENQQSELDKVRGEMTSLRWGFEETTTEMRGITTLGETYVKIFRQDEPMKNQYRDSLDAFLRKMSNCIDDKRSGALDVMEYYGALNELAVSVEADFERHESSTHPKYSGEIWALTFLLDDEWDDASIHEVKWFETLSRLDKKGIRTRRLWALDARMIAPLQKEKLDEDALEFLNRLSLYCSTTTQFPNTESYALPKNAILDEHVRLFGKGFFAVAYPGANPTNGAEYGLIRGVCFDNLLSTNSLGGEIDFDERRIKTIRGFWEKYLELAVSLKDFVYRNSGAEARAYIEEHWLTNGEGGESDGRVNSKTE